MNDSIYSRLQAFLIDFGQLKMVTDNNPNSLCLFEQTTAEMRAAAARMHDYLTGSQVEVELFHGVDKLVIHAPDCIESEWAEFRRLWEPKINYLAMCEYDPDWPRDYQEHLRLYAGSGVVPNDGDDVFIPGFHDGPAAIRQAINYLQDSGECRAGGDAVKYLIETVGLDLAKAMERWEKVPHTFMPRHVAQEQQFSKLGPLNELFDDAMRAYVCGASAACLAMCRALLETVLKQAYLPGESKEVDQFGKERDLSLSALLAKAGRRYGSIPIATIKPLVRISNDILHGTTRTEIADEKTI